MKKIIRDIGLEDHSQLTYENNVTAPRAGFGRVLGTPVTVRFIWRGVTVGLGGFPEEGYGKTGIFER